MSPQTVTARAVAAPPGRCGTGAPFAYSRRHVPGRRRPHTTPVSSTCRPPPAPGPSHPPGGRPVSARTVAGSVAAGPRLRARPWHADAEVAHLAPAPDHLGPL